VDHFGGVKNLCLEYEEKLELVDRDGKGGGYVREIVPCRIALETKVEVKPGIKPSRGWGCVFPWSIGILRTKNGKYVTVDFPEHSGWQSLGSEIMVSSEVDASKSGYGCEDPTMFQARATPLAQSDCSSALVAVLRRLDLCMQRRGSLRKGLIFRCISNLRRIQKLLWP
jgi:hypothetical protein